MADELFPVFRIEMARIVELTLPTSLDSSEFDRINQALIARVSGEPSGHWVLDLAQMSYMGSAALGLMVNVRQQIKQGGGKLVLCCMSAKLHQIFRTCCMERLFDIRPSRADALKSLGVKHTE